MSSSQIQEFVAKVVYDHSVATGLKACQSDQQIVDYASQVGFKISIEEWLVFVESDFSSLSSTEKERIAIVDPQHWSGHSVGFSPGDQCLWMACELAIIASLE